MGSWKDKQLAEKGSRYHGYVITRSDAGDVTDVYKVGPLNELTLPPQTRYDNSLDIVRDGLSINVPAGYTMQSFVLGRGGKSPFNCYQEYHRAQEPQPYSETVAPSVKTCLEELASK